MTVDQYTVDDFLLDDSFLAYCRGTDPQAVAFWTNWLQTAPVNLSAFREAERLCRVLSAEQPRLDEALGELDAMIAARTPPDVVVRPLPVVRTGGGAWRRWAVAAVVLLVGTLAGLGYQYWNGQYVVYATAYNEQRTVTLSDGSTVQLNSHSTLKHRRNGLSGAAREVELDGEAFFSVRHTAADAPFRVVLPGSFDVQVLGTEFSVYHRADRQRVVLNTGRVRVDFHDRRPALSLQPGQLVEVGGAGLVEPRPVRPEQYNAWTRQQFVFEQATVAEVIRAVEEQFGVTVRPVGAELAQRRFTGILPINKPETVLNALAELARLRVERDGNTYTIRE